AQDPGSPSSWSPAYGLPIIARGQAMSDIGGLNPPLNTYPTIPIPTGDTADAGVYTSVEYVLLTPTRDNRNQPIPFHGLVASGGPHPPLNTYPTIPIPTGNTADAGFYTSVEYVMLTQTRDIGNQVIAFRGLVDSSGQITGLPGIYVGSGQVGLTTEEFARTTFS